MVNESDSSPSTREPPVGICPACEKLEGLCIPCAKEEGVDYSDNLDWLNGE